MADAFSRAERWARRHPGRVAGVRLNLLLVRVAKGFVDARVMGLAAEMTYYALLSIFPLIAALGASLGFLEGVIGTEAVEEVEAAVIVSLRTVFSPEATDDVIAPLVQGLLQQERTGFAIGGFLVTLFLASRVFRSAIETLDQAYRVEEGRGMLTVWGLGLLFALGAIVTSTAMLAMVVVGPLLGGGRAIAEWLGLGQAFEITWALARWPAVLAVGTGFLAVLYRVGPNVRNRWRESLPGAVFGVVGLILVSVGFRGYLEVTGLESPEIRDAAEAVVVGGQVIGAILAALLWLWLSTMVVLTGGVVNAALSRLRLQEPEPKEPAEA
jgi:membrane protein